ncbi:MAG: iron-sulfur cluster assembly protein, partial [Nevskiales bacterium]
MSEAALQAVLAEYIDPHLQTDLLSAGVVEQIEFDQGRARVAICLGFPCDQYADAFKARLRERLLAVDEVSEAEVQLRWEVQSHA